jgi:hypothetical protein
LQLRGSEKGTALMHLGLPYGIQWPFKIVLPWARMRCLRVAQEG